METVVDFPEFLGAYKSYSDEHPSNAQNAYEKQKLLTYTLKPLVQFITRADEVAYYKYGQGKIASWMGNRKWQSGYKPPKGKVEWNLMTLSNDFALRYRIKEISQRVAVDE